MSNQMHAGPETAPHSTHASHIRHAPPPPPQAQLMQLATGYWASRMVYLAAELGLADHLAGGPKSAVEIAGPTKSHALSLHRVMRALASLGVLAEREHDRFALTALGEALRSDAQGSVRSAIRSLAGQWAWKSWEEFAYSVQTGKTGSQKALGMPVFDYLAQHPDQASLFSEAMVGIHGGEPPAVAAAYDFSKFRTIVDVGGATGNLLAHILKRHAQPRGVLYDRPHVVVDALKLIAAHGLTDRITIESGDFFQRVPTIGSGDAMILSHVIHDWTEQQCLKILGNCRTAMKSGGTLLVVESVLPAWGARVDEPHFGKLLDVVMLVMPGGQERTEAEYATLLGKAGFRLTTVTPTTSAVSVVEAMPA